MPIAPCIHPVVMRAHKHGEIFDSKLFDAVADHLGDCPVCARQSEKIADSALLEWGAQSGITTHLDGFAETMPDDVNDLPAVVLQSATWRWLGRLGRGGSGEVYLARNKVTNQLQAVKIIPLRTDRDPNARDRIRRESLIADVSPHENLLMIGEPQIVGSHALFSMQHILGEDLEHLAQRVGGKLSVADACGLMLQALAGLDHASRHGLVHRDLKPANLMLGHDGGLRILDFGLAKLRTERPEDDLTATYASGVGTPLYMAPEQAASLKSADIRSDLYSVGATLYRLLAGRPPFDGSTGHASPEAIFAAHRLQTPRSLSELRPDVPKGVNEVVQKMLAKKPKDRYQSAREAARALVPFADEENRRRATSWLLEETVGVATKRPRVRNRLTLIAVAALGSAAVALGVLLNIQTKAGLVTLEVDQKDVQVTIDDQPAKVTNIRVANGDKTLVEIVAAKGAHRLEVKKAGFRIWSDDLQVDLGKGNRIQVQLQPEKIATTPVPSQLPEAPAVAVRNGGAKSPPEPKLPADDWRPLFNGRDLTGWRQTEGRGDWAVDAGELVGSTTTRGLITERRDFGDYHLRMDVFLSPDANSGLFLRISPPEWPQNDAGELLQNVGENGHYEIDLWIPNDRSWYTLGTIHRVPVDEKRSFGVVRRDPPTAAGEWFTHEVRLKGGEFTVLVNSKIITTFTDRRPLSDQGAIGLRNFYPRADATIKFRNLAIRELH